MMAEIGSSPTLATGVLLQRTILVPSGSPAQEDKALDQSREPDPAGHDLH